MTELLELLKRHRFRHIPGLCIPRDEISEVFAGRALCDAGMSGEIDHEAILPTNLARQKINERLLQAAETGVFVIEFHDFIESQLTQELADGLGIFDGTRDFRRKEIVLDPDHDAPGLVIQTFRLSDLSVCRSEPETDDSEDREEV